MKISNLRVENVVTPIGVDEKKPTFSWTINGKENNIFQNSYRIIVAADNEFKNILWDSKTVKSDKTYDITYSGKALEPATRYYFKVIADVNGKLLHSKTSKFTTGLLNEKFDADWVAISPKVQNIPENSAFARKAFDAENVDYATLFIYSYGWYEAYMNGKKLDDRIFTTAKSKYPKILFYDAYDVTDLLTDGKNVMSLILGDGYNSNANGFMGVWQGGKRFIASLNIHHTDGTIENIKSDNSWKFSLDTPLLANNIYNGEFYDATREIENWKDAQFDDSAWDNMYPVTEANKAKFYCNIGPFIKIIEEIKPKKIYELKDGRYILDFGQNIAGFVKFSLSKKRYDRIRIKTAEEISKDPLGVCLNTQTNRAAASIDTYIFKGEGLETHYPMFNYHGFRYAEISGLDQKPKGNDIVACVVHTEFSHISSFKTDNELLNRIYLNALWSVRSNTYSYPSDCPNRDERTPCPMDLYVYLDTALYLFEPCNYYMRNLMNDIIMIKKPVAGRYDMTWCACAWAMVWSFYRYYGNKTLIKKYYGQLKYKFDFYLSQYEKLTKRASELFGDWCAPNVPGNYSTSYSSSAETEQLMKYRTCKMMSDMATVIGKNDDAERYAELAVSSAEEYKIKFFDKRKQLFSNGKQAPNIYALASDFLTDKERTNVGKNLLKIYKENGNKLDLGIFGIRNFVEVLSDLGEIDVALDCFMNPEFPSFAHQISKGATTLWEQWCGYGDMASHNHAMFAGSVSGFFTRLAGITSTDTAFKKIQIKPVLSRHINKLSTAIQTINGEVKVEYKIVDNQFELKVVIPPNTVGEIIMPNGERHNVGNGTFKLVCTQGA